jgi:hypothetical protein
VKNIIDEAANSHQGEVGRAAWGYGHELFGEDYIERAKKIRQR